MRSLVVSIVLTTLALGLWLSAPLMGRDAGLAAPAAAQAGYAGKLIAGRLDGLWILPLDGSAPIKVLGVGEREYVTGVAWSPSATEIAYTLLTFDASLGMAGSDLHLTTLDGADRLLVQRDKPGATLGAPVWAPDGGSLLFDYTSYDMTGSGGLTQRIERVALDGSWRSVEVDNAFAPTLSDDGRFLVYLRFEGVGISIRRRSLETGLESEVLPAGIIAGIYLPSLSPDGATIAFAANRGTNAAPDTGPCEFLDQPQGRLLDAPRARAHGLPKEVWRIGSDGQGLTRLTNYCLDDPVLAWSPDGGWLAAYGGTSLVLLRADGSSPIPVWSEGSYGGVDWAP